MAFHHHSALFSRLAFWAFSRLLAREPQLSTPMAVVIASFSSAVRDCFFKSFFKISIASGYSIVEDSLAQAETINKAKQPRLKDCCAHNDKNILWPGGVHNLRHVTWAANRHSAHAGRNLINEDIFDGQTKGIEH